MIYSVISRSRYSFIQPHNTTVFAFLAPKLSGSSDQQKTFWSTSSVWNFTTDVMRQQYKRIFKGGDPVVFVVILIGEKADRSGQDYKTTKLSPRRPVCDWRSLVSYTQHNFFLPNHDLSYLGCLNQMTTVSQHTPMIVYNCWCLSIYVNYIFDIQHEMIMSYLVFSVSCIRWCTLHKSLCWT